MTARPPTRALEPHPIVPSTSGDPVSRRPSTRTAAVAALAAVALLAAACGSSSSSSASASAAPAASAPSAASSAMSDPGSSPAASAATSSSAVAGKITVFAAASLTKAFTTLGTRFQTAHPGTTVTFSFDASSALAQQIISGAPADVFASASARNMTQVTAAGDAADAKTFADNVAEIAVAPSSAGKVTSIADLGKAGVKVALCQPQVPCGALAQTVLATAKVTVKPVTQGLDVKSTLAYVTSGEVDAAVVYVTDVLAAGAEVKGVLIPAADNASTAYPIATVKGSRNPATAAAFEALVLSPAGQAVLAAAGFRKP